VGRIPVVSPSTMSCLLTNEIVCSFMAARCAATPDGYLRRFKKYAPGRSGLALRGVARRGMAWRSAVWHGAVCCGDVVLWCCDVVVSYGMAWWGWCRCRGWNRTYLPVRVAAGLSNASGQRHKAKSVHVKRSISAWRACGIRI
jgi:hypothetical protein